MGPFGDKIYITFTSGLGGIKGRMYKGRCSQFLDFKCRAHRAELIPSSVLQCVPAMGQPGIFYIKTTNMCLVS